MNYTNWTTNHKNEPSSNVLFTPSFYLPIESLDTQTHSNSNLTLEQTEAKTIINTHVWDIQQLANYLDKLNQQLSLVQSDVKTNQLKASETCQSTLQSCKLALKELDQLASQLSQSLQCIQSKKSSLSTSIHPLITLYHEYKTLQDYVQYFTLLREWICLKDSPNSLHSWQNLTQLRKKAHQTLGSCSFTQHLDQFMEKEKLSLINHYKALLNNTLEEIGWPNQLNQDNPKKLQIVIEAYECLHSISEEEAMNTMIDSLSLRFQYHFLSDRPTNQLVHPEWYLSFLRTPLIEHQTFIFTCFQHHYLPFIQAWLQLAIHKFLMDLPSLLEHPSPALLLKTLLLLATFVCDLQSIYFLDLSSSSSSSSSSTLNTKEKEFVSLQEEGLKLDLQSQTQIVDHLKKYMEKTLIEWIVDLPNIWDPIEDAFLSESFSMNNGSLAFANSFDSLTIKRPLIWYKLSSYNDVFLSLAKKLHPSFSRLFIEKVASSTLLACSQHLESHFLSTLSSVSSSSSSSSSSSLSRTFQIHFSLLSLYPLFFQLLLDWSFEIPEFTSDALISTLDTTFKSLLSQFIDTVSLTFFNLLQSDVPFVPFLTSFFHLAQSTFTSTSTHVTSSFTASASASSSSSSSSSTYLRFFQLCLTSFDDLVLKWLSRPVSRSVLARVLPSFLSLLTQFSPLPTLEVPKTQFILDLAKLSMEESQRQIEAVLETGPEAFVQGLSVADYVKISQNLI